MPLPSSAVALVLWLRAVTICLAVLEVVDNSNTGGMLEETIEALRRMVRSTFHSEEVMKCAKFSGSAMFDRSNAQNYNHHIAAHRFGHHYTPMLSHGICTAMCSVSVTEAVAITSRSIEHKTVHVANGCPVDLHHLAYFYPDTKYILMYLPHEKVNLAANGRDRA
jgi:hypothetical protein